jgi:hypothetical protein
MRIENLRSEEIDGRPCVAATVVWEDSERPAHELYYGTDEAFKEDLTLNPHGFLVACTMPAMWHGEQRLFMDEEICPQLQDGLETAMALIRHWWYPEEKKMPRLEVKTRASIPSVADTDRRAGMFFSGGIDSLASFRKNRVRFPLEHPWSVKDGVLIFGLETDEIEKFEHVKRHLSDFSAEAGLTLIPVYTNVRYLDDDWMFWQNQFQDSVYASVSHLFSRRFRVLSISSTYNVPHMQPDGSHPLLDINYSSSDMIIRHDAIQLSRLDKMKLVAEWDLAFQNIRTCNKSELYQSDQLNCGRCWKCVSAMLAFMALGVLEKTKAFPPEELTPQLVESVMEIFKQTICFYEELPPLLREKGRPDLAAVIEQKIAIYQNRKEKATVKRVLKGEVKRLDEKYLKGLLKTLVVSMRPASRREHS